MRLVANAKEVVRESRGLPVASADKYWPFGAASFEPAEGIGERRSASFSLRCWGWVRGVALWPVPATGNFFEAALSETLQEMRGCKGILETKRVQTMGFGR